MGIDRRGAPTSEQGKKRKKKEQGKTEEEPPPKSVLRHRRPPHSVVFVLAAVGGLVSGCSTLPVERRKDRQEATRRRERLNQEKQT